MTDNITIVAVRDVDYRRDNMGRTHERESIRLTITPKIARQIVAIATNPTTSLDNGGEPWNMLNSWMNEKPAAPADDEATIRAMVNAFITGLNASSKTYDGAVRKILDAIRRGEVPGLPSPDEHAALKADAERLRKKVAYIDANFDVRKWHKLEADKNAAIARAEKAEHAVVQQDTGPAFVAAIGGRYYLVGVSDEDPTKVAPAWHNMTEADSKAVAEQLKTLLDARAAHAEAMELLRRWVKSVSIYGGTIVNDTNCHLAKHQNKGA